VSADSGLIAALLRALGALLGVHIQHAKTEAANDLGRILVGVCLMLLGVLVTAMALMLGSYALVLYVDRVSSLDRLQAAIAVGGIDLCVALLFVLMGVRRLRKPVLKETRALVRRTAETLTAISGSAS
jgi:putative superfamily III holin-X